MSKRASQGRDPRMLREEIKALKEPTRHPAADLAVGQVEEI